MKWFITIKKLLNYSFNDINWEYSKLSTKEKTLVTEQEFLELKSIFK